MHLGCHPFRDSRKMIVRLASHRERYHRGDSFDNHPCEWHPTNGSWEGRRRRCLFRGRVDSIPARRHRCAFPRRDAVLSFVLGRRWSISRSRRRKKPSVSQGACGRAASRCRRAVPFGAVSLAGWRPCCSFRGSRAGTADRAWLGCGNQSLPRVATWFFSFGQEIVCAWPSPPAVKPSSQRRLLAGGDSPRGATMRRCLSARCGMGHHGFGSA